MNTYEEQFRSEQFVMHWLRQTQVDYEQDRGYLTPQLKIDECHNINVLAFFSAPHPTQRRWQVVPELSTREHRAAIQRLVEKRVLTPQGEDCSRWYTLETTS
jgi:hypothetical protein